jgi:hypothetical protein
MTSPDGAFVPLTGNTTPANVRLATVGTPPVEFVHAAMICEIERGVIGAAEAFEAGTVTVAVTVSIKSAVLMLLVVEMAVLELGRTVV